MREKFELYNEHGQVEDPEIARSMADKESPSHEKFLGVFPASKRRIAEGEKLGEIEGKIIINQKNHDAKIEEFQNKIKKLEVLKEYEAYDTGIYVGGDRSLEKYREVSLEMDGHRIKLTMSKLGGSYRIARAGGSIDNRHITNREAWELFGNEGFTAINWLMYDKYDKGGKLSPGIE